MASAQDCDPKPGEPPSTPSPQSVQVKTWRELWWYGNNGEGDEFVKSRSVVDNQTAENRIVRAPVVSGNPNTNRFVIVFCYFSDSSDDKALYFLCSEEKLDIVHLIIYCFSSEW